MNRNFLKLAAIFILLVFVGLVVWQITLDKRKAETVFCALDAKMCPDGSFVSRIPPACDFAPCTTSSAEKFNIANPASENCVAQGGVVDIRENPDGQYGVCVFADKSECEEWAFYRKECLVEKNR